MDDTQQKTTDKIIAILSVKFWNALAEIGKCYAARSAAEKVLINRIVVI